MKDIQRLIARASGPDESLSVRHDAFAELVTRFQDMAFACAYAILGDSYLAEDVAQEAFVIAWQKLEQLREPAAFAGWLKRIVLSQCNRVTRGKRVQILPLETEINKPTSDPSPQAVAEKRELLTKVLRAIKALPDNERLVTTLFYVDGYTQMDIGEFLEVPVSTVNKRLYTARQRLKESVHVFKDNLQEQKPSRDGTFVDRVTAKLRQPVIKDWLSISKLAFARHEADVPGNDLWLRRRQNFDEANYVRQQFVAEDAGQILGYGAIEQTVYLPRYQLLLVMDPRWLKVGVGDLLLERLFDELKKADAVTVSCREYASETELVTFLKERGFAEVDQTLDLRLDVAQTDISRFPNVFERIEGLEITISTLAEERDRDPRYAEKLYELETIVRQDDPARSPFVPPAYNAREALLWLEMPYVLRDAYFIARRGETYVGMCDVSLFDAVPGGLTHGFTGVRREYRRQGVATALKLRAINYAKQNGYRLIQSFNRPAQMEVLALNYKLGFQLSSARITLEKCLREVIAIDPRVYDQYAGRYCDCERRPDLEMVVRNENGRLTIECVGQKVELFPVSETQFFVKQFYGEATFQRDETGRVNLLKFEMPAYKNRRQSLQYAKRIE